MMYVCSNCRDGTYYEEEEILVPEPQPHGELLHYHECPRCADRDHLVALDSDGIKQLWMWARVSEVYRGFASDVLYDIASEQVMV